MASHWATSEKRVPAHPPVSHYAAGFVAPAGFSAPTPPAQLAVGRLKLHAAMARTGLAAHASSAVIQWRIASASAEVDYCIDDASGGFELSKDLMLLNGAERTALVGRIGAGMCELYMDSLGYVWRDQANALIPTRAPLADFIYAGPPTQGLGVAITEAKGSTQSLTPRSAQEHVNKAYLRQVEAYLGTSTTAGSVIHGYAIGLRAPLERPAYLCVAESAAPLPGGGGPGGGLGQEEGTTDDEGQAPGQGRPRSARVSVSMLLGNYATVLALVGKHHSAWLMREVQAGGVSPLSAAEALDGLIDQHEHGFIQGRIRGTFFPYSGIRFAVRVEPILDLVSLLRTMRPADGVGEIVNFRILPENLEATADPDFVQFPDGLAGFAIARGEALQVEAGLPPEPLLDWPFRGRRMAETITAKEGEAEPTQEALAAMKYHSAS